MGKTGYFLEIPKILHFSVPYTQDIKLNDISQKWSVQHKSCFTQHWVHGSVESWIFLHLKGVHPSVSPRFENSPPYQLLSPHVSHQLSPKFSSIPTVQFLCTHCWVPSSLPYPLFSPYVPTFSNVSPTCGLPWTLVSNVSQMWVQHVAYLEPGTQMWVQHVVYLEPGTQMWVQHKYCWLEFPLTYFD